MAGSGPQLRGRIGVDGEREFKAALTEAGRSVRMVNSELELLTAQYKANGASMELYQQQHEALSRKLAAQRTQVTTMEDVLEAVKRKFGDNSDQAAKYTEMLNRARAALTKTEGELRANELAMQELAAQTSDAADGVEELGAAADKSGKGIKGSGDNAGDAADKHNLLGKAAKATGALLTSAMAAGAAAVGSALAAMSIAAVKAAADLTAVGTAQTQATNLLSAQTGATGAELEELSTIARNVYEGGMGESISEVNAALAATRQTTHLTGKELEIAANAGFALRDTFGFEFQESGRAASSLMANFGVSAEQAYNLMAVGAQRGANQNGDMLDVLSEYGPMFAAMGMSADQMMSALISGSESGVFSIDKVGDALKEFSIRCVDGSETTRQAFASVGLDADAMAQQFAMGGDNARHAFATTVDAIMAIEDPVKRSQTAVQLFGTQFEDLGPDVLQVLADMAESGELTADALEQISAVRYDDLSSSAEGFRRLVEGELMPMAQRFSGIAKGVVDNARMALSDGFQAEDVRTIGMALSTALVEGIAEIDALMGKALPVIEDAVAIIGETLTTVLPSLIDTVLPAAMSLVEGLLSSLTSNLTPLMQTATRLATSLAGFLARNAGRLIAAGQQILTGLISGISQALPELVPAAITVIGELAVGLISAIPTLIAQLPAIFGGVVEGIAAIDWMSLGSRILTAISDGLAAVGTTLQELFTAGWTLIKDIKWEDVGSAILAGATSALDAAGTWLKGLFDTAWSAVSGIDWDAVGSTILAGATSALDAAGAWLKGLFDTAWSAVKSISWGDLGSAIKGGVTSAIDTVGSWLSGLFGAGKDAATGLSWSDLGSTIKAGATTALDAAGSWLSAAMEAGKSAASAIPWSDVGAAIKGGVQSAIDVGGAFLSGGFDAAKAAIDEIDWQTIGSSVGSAISTGVQGAVDTAGAFLSGSFTMAQSTIEAIQWADIGSSIGSAISTGVQGAVDTAGAFLSGGFTMAQSTIEAIQWADIGSSIGSAISTGITGVIDTGGKFLSGAFTAAKTAIDEIDWAGIGSAISGGLNAAISALASIGSSIWDTITGWFSGPGELSEPEQMGNDIVDDMSTGITNGTAGLTEAAQAAAESVIQIMHDTLGTADGDSSVTKGMGESLRSGLVKGLEIVGATSFAGAATNVYNAFSAAVNTAFGVGDKKSTKFNSIGMQVCASLAKGITNGNDNSDAIKAAITDVANIAYSQAVTEISEGLTGSTTAVNTAVSAVVNIVYEAAAISLSKDRGGKIGSDFGAGIRRGMYNQGSSIRAAASSLGSQALTALWTAVGANGSRFNTIGIAIADGVAAGIRSGSGVITAAAREAADAAYTSICKEMEISSPSRKTKRARRWTTIGYAEGITESRDRVAAAAATMSRAAMTPLIPSSPAVLTIDYDKLGDSVARANREAGIGTAVLDVDGKRMSRDLERGVMSAGQTRSRQSISGRSARMMTV